MAQVLKVDEWQGATAWYVADVHTWTNWRALADIFDTDFDGFKQLLTDKYKATIYRFIERKDKDSSLLFGFQSYRNAHQFKLDVNRIARKKNYMVEKQL